MIHTMTEHQSAQSFSYRRNTVRGSGTEGNTSLAPQKEDSCP